MVKIQINGKRRILPDSLTIQEILDRFEIPSAAIAVAVNSEIIPQSFHEKVRVRDGDRIEVVRAVGGG